MKHPDLLPCRTKRPHPEVIQPRLKLYACDCLTDSAGGFPGGSVVKNPPAAAGDAVGVGQEDPVQKEVAAHSSILAWETSWTEEPGG